MVFYLKSRSKAYSSRIQKQSRRNPHNYYKRKVVKKTKKSNNQREEGAEKQRYIIIKTMAYIWVLGGATLTLYFVFDLLVQQDARTAIYGSAILSAWTGSVWGVIMNDLASMWRTEKSYDELKKDSKNIRKTFWKWCIWGALSLIYFSVLLLIISHTLQ